MKPRFELGSWVQFIGIVAEFYPGRVGRIIAVMQSQDGDTHLDQYTVLISGLGERVAWDFQLARAPATSSEVVDGNT